ncbi:MAG: hypothetical protein CVU39_09030 [Chloroflexi bacterium HGW-Chloroflexi-10]|nr:MAG: hypothetical protein CVU39_09030 [Chloroflexi bacterium HGW-Chloroflexi-10]
MEILSSSPFSVRLFDPAQDFPALVELVNAIEAVDRSGEATTEDQQRAQLSWPGRDLLRDRWVVTAAEQQDQLLGYGDSWKKPTTPTADIYVGVHPVYRCRGLGGELLRRILVRAGEQCAAHVAVYADANNSSSQHFLRQRGFAVAGAYFELHTSMPHVIEVPHWPAGYTLRRFSETPNLPGLVDTLNRSYGDRFGHKITTETEIQRRLDLDPHSISNILLLFDAQEALIGVCRVHPTNNEQANQDSITGYLDGPGVVPTHRQEGLYRSLALAGMQRLRELGQTQIVLESWGDEEHIISDYIELGFTCQRHFLAYRHSL